MHIAQTPLAVIPPVGAKLTEVAGWDRGAFPYLVTAAWDEDLLIVVQTRDQKTMRLINAVTGEMIREDTDPHWTDVIDGVPAQLPGGDIVWTEISEDTRGLIVAPAAELATATPLTPAGLQVRPSSAPTATTCCSPGRPSPPSSASGATAPTGSRRSPPSPASTPPRPAAGRPCCPAGRWPAARSPCGSRADGAVTGGIASFAQEPNLPHPAPQFIEAGPAGIRTAVLFPSWY